MEENMSGCFFLNTVYLLMQFHIYVDIYVVTAGSLRISSW